MALLQLLQKQSTCKINYLSCFLPKIKLIFAQKQANKNSASKLLEFTLNSRSIQRANHPNSVFLLKAQKSEAKDMEEVDWQERALQDRLDSDRSNLLSSRLRWNCPQFVPSSEVTPKVCPLFNSTQLEKAEKILEYLKSKNGSITDLMVISGEKNKNRLRQKVLYPLIGAELIEPTIKETSNSPKQSYALTEKSKAYMNKKE